MGKSSDTACVAFVLFFLSTIYIDETIMLMVRNIDGAMTVPILLPILNTNRRPGKKFFLYLSDLIIYFVGNAETSFGSGRSRLSLPNFRTASALLNESMPDDRPSWARHDDMNSKKADETGLSSLMVPAARSSVIHNSRSMQSDRSYSECDSMSRTRDRSPSIIGIDDMILVFHVFTLY